MTIQRCEWVTADPLYIAYHDDEWGRPVHDDRRWFEKISLEGAEAGLSWITILKRRENYRIAYDNFDPHIVATYGEDKIAELLQNAGLIRNKLKIRSVVTNAQAFLKIQEEFGSFDAFVWPFVGGQPKINCFRTIADAPATTPESDALSKALKKRGFSFVGSAICYAMMQSHGMVNDHTAQCFLHPCR